MLNSLNALSENGSLWADPPWRNKWLLIAIAGSIISHCFIVYVPFLRASFGLASIGAYEWLLVLVFSIPVILIDELLKSISRKRENMKIKKIMEEFKSYKKDDGIELALLSSTTSTTIQMDTNS